MFYSPAKNNGRINLTFCINQIEHKSDNEWNEWMEVRENWHDERYCWYLLLLPFIDQIPIKKQERERERERTTMDQLSNSLFSLYIIHILE